MSYSKKRVQSMAALLLKCVCVFYLRSTCLWGGRCVYSLKTWVSVKLSCKNISQVCTLWRLLIIRGLLSVTDHLHTVNPLVLSWATWSGFNLNITQKNDCFWHENDVPFYVMFPLRPVHADLPSGRVLSMGTELRVHQECSYWSVLRWRSKETAWGNGTQGS